MKQLTEYSFVAKWICLGKVAGLKKLTSAVEGHAGEVEVCVTLPIAISIAEVPRKPHLDVVASVQRNRHVVGGVGGCTICGAGLVNGDKSCPAWGFAFARGGGGCCGRETGHDIEEERISLS